MSAVKAAGGMFSASHNACQVPAGSRPCVVSASGCPDTLSTILRPHAVLDLNASS